jgi:hypothetical protein
LRRTSRSSRPPPVACKDRLLGGTGNDRIRTAGSTTDDIDCGPGRDAVMLDLLDHRRRCERVTRIHA